MDPLSAAASGIGIVSLGIQIADSIQKCLRFWKSVKGAPSDFERIVEDLEVLDEVLNSVMAYHQGLQRSEDSPQPVPLPRALQSCANRLMDVVRTISDLEQGFQTRKLWTSLRTVLREEEIAKVRRDLESAKSSLILSNQLVLSQLQKAQYRNLVAQQKNIAVITQSVAQISIAVAKPSIKGSLRRRPAGESRFEQGHVEELLDDEDGESGIRAKEEKIVAKRKSLSTSNSSKRGGILRRGFSMYSQRALRGRRIVPDDSPVFKYARFGDVEKLWNLFDKGLASPFDTDPYGYTPLHFAASNLRAFACKVLIDLGGDCNSLSSNGFTPLALVSTGTLDLGTQSIEAVVDITRNFVEHGADPFMDTPWGIPVSQSYRGTINGLKVLKNQDPFGGSMATHGVHGWGVLHEQLLRSSYHDPFLIERLRFWIMQGADVNVVTGLPLYLRSSKRTWAIPSGSSLLHAACFGSISYFKDGFFLLLLKPGLLELFLDAGAHIHAMDARGCTLLRIISRIFRPEECFRWFQMLWNLGVDLAGYIDFECSLYQERLEDFNPMKVWNSAIQYGLGRRTSRDQQDPSLVHVSKLFEEPLEEYRGNPEVDLAYYDEVDSEADVSEADSLEVDLSEADLSEADLSEADFSEADVSGVDVPEADFSEPNIPEADDPEAISPKETKETALEKKSKLPSSRSVQNVPALDYQHLPTTDTQVSMQPNSNIAGTSQLKRKKAARDLKCAGDERC